MISIIIASVDKTMLDNLKQNIASTIGVPFEIIAFENKAGKGIAEVYNQEALKANYNILCFTHEDVIFRTNNWGKLLIKHFESIENVGLIGVVGSTYKSLAPSGWFADAAPLQTSYGHFIQHYKYSVKPTLYYNEERENNNYTEAVAVDGFWLCTTKTIFKAFKFDPVICNNFHCYDIDFSLNVGKKNKVIIVFDILIEHLSEGMYDKQWVTETLKLHKKWKPYLPAHINPMSKKEIVLIEKRNFRHFIAFAVKNSFSKWQLINVLWQTALYKISFLLFIKLHVSIFINPYKNKFNTP